MVFKTPFLKKALVRDYDPTADESNTWDLTNNPLGALWIGIKGDLAADEKCDDELMDLIDLIHVQYGAFDVVRYTEPPLCVMMNMQLKQNRYMITGNGMNTDDIRGVIFPILFGAPYLLEDMCLPKDHDNKKTLTLQMDIADANFDDLLVDIHQVILPDAKPKGFIKQHETSISARGTGEQDIKLQTNWDLLKLLFQCPTVPDDSAWTSTIEWAGLELDDFYYGYEGVNWEALHGELMDEMGGMAGIENHFHDDPSSGVTGFPEDLEHWVREFGVMDFFHEKNLKWKAPLSQVSNAKLKVYYGVDEAIKIAQALYVPISGYEKRTY